MSEIGTRQHQRFAAIEAFVAAQEPLTDVAKEVLYSNLWKLYE